jgi:AraC-like DNA-binding protein
MGDSLIFLQSIIYLIAAFLLYFKAIKNKNNKKNLSIRWLKVYLQITAIFILITLPMGFIENGRIAGIYIAVFSLVYFIVLLWRSLVYSKYYTNEKLSVNEVVAHPQVSVLMEIIAQRKLYTNKNISPDLVASELEINKQDVLNNFTNGLSFNDFISQLRVNDAKSKLLNPQFEHYTVEAIGKEAGFHSRSTFYDAFKKYTGQTPTQFRLEKKTLTN